MKDQTIINYILHKQSLIEKKSDGNFDDLLINHIGLHSTDYLTPYISLWNRVKDFKPIDLFNGLNNQDYLRKRAFRGVVFLIHRKLLPIIQETSKIFARDWFKGFKKELIKSKVNFDVFTKKALSFFNNKKELTVHDLKRLMIDIDLLPKNLFSLALRYYELNGFLVRTSHNYLTDNRIQYGLVEDFYPEINDNPMTSEEALIQLFYRYIEQFGPITLEDFSWWLPTTMSTTKILLSKIIEEIAEIKFNNQSYYMLKNDYELLKDYEYKENKDIINFLPYEDHFPKAYKNREWFLSKVLEKVVIGQARITMGQFYPTIWLNGKIIGQWEIIYQNKDKTSATVEIKHLMKNSNLTIDIIDQINKEKINLEIFLNNLLLPLNKKRNRKSE